MGERESSASPRHADMQRGVSNEHFSRVGYQPTQTNVYRGHPTMSKPFYLYSVFATQYIVILPFRRSKSYKVKVEVNSKAQFTYL